MNPNDPQITINLENTPVDIAIYGGESKDICSYYGIQFGGISLELNPKTAISLVNKLKEHLEVNGCKL